MFLGQYLSQILYAFTEDIDGWIASSIYTVWLCSVKLWTIFQIFATNDIINECGNCVSNNKYYK